MQCDSRRFGASTARLLLVPAWCRQRYPAKRSSQWREAALRNWQRMRRSKPRATVERQRAASPPRQRRPGAKTERHSSLATGASSQHERPHNRPAPKSPLLLLTANVRAKAEAIGKTSLRARETLLG